MSQTLFEKLQLKNEKNLLIQGLPSSIEKQFNKLSFAKNMTPLLKSRKIDFALVFAVSESQLKSIWIAWLSLIPRSRVSLNDNNGPSILQITVLGKISLVAKMPFPNFDDRISTLCFKKKFM